MDTSRNKRVVEDGLIGLAVVGSRLYGMNTPDSDVDMMGVAIEPPSRILGFNQFEQDETTFNGTVYGLRKFCALLLKGNPTVNELLWAPKYQVNSKLFQELIGFRTRLINQQMGKAYLGYLRAQRERLNGTRGQMDINRRELVLKYGYDTKYAAHAMRLGMIGWNLLKFKTIQFPLQDDERKLLLDVRAGMWNKETILDMIMMYEGMIDGLLGQVTPLVPTEKLEKWMLRAYRRWWNEHEEMGW